MTAASAYVKSLTRGSSTGLGATATTGSAQHMTARPALVGDITEVVLIFSLFIFLLLERTCKRGGKHTCVHAHKHTDRQ